VGPGCALAALRIPDQTLNHQARCDDQVIVRKGRVVTGGRLGWIGLATVRALLRWRDAHNKCTVDEKREEAAQDLGDVATVVTADVRSTQEVDKLLDTAIELHGRIDCPSS
jgi:NAD(P)-dependent dehydrogenase (short-subunit alcohol dehydrogenase family)